MDFEWDERKSRINEELHGIDFKEASKLFDGRHFVVKESPRRGEPRWIATGEYGGRLWSVVFTLRQMSVRIISARAARKNEKERYHSSLHSRGD